MIKQNITIINKLGLHDFHDNSVNKITAFRQSIDET